MTGQAEILAMFFATQQARLPAVWQMAGAAGQIPFPIERILSGQASLWRKATGVADLNRSRVAPCTK
jgi:hypothetical protein